MAWYDPESSELLSLERSAFTSELVSADSTKRFAHNAEQNSEKHHPLVAYGADSPVTSVNAKTGNIV